MSRQKSAYSIIELIVVVLIVGALTLIAVPRLNMAALYRKKAHTVAKKIVTDLRRTRRLAISYAATNSSGFSLNMAGSSPYAGYQIVDDSNSVAVDSHSIDPQISCSGGDNFSFGPLGNLLTGSDTELTVSASGRTYTITVISGTGIVKCAEN